MTLASLAVEAGANVEAVQRMLGHASAAMTLDAVCRRSCGVSPSRPNPATQPRRQSSRPVTGRPVIQGINFENFDFHNVYEVAESSTLHPAFQE